MKPKNAHTGFALVLAWPQTYCKQPGAWYDGLSSLLHLSKNNYYQVGHAAIVLISIKKQRAFYFDFGRYHAPFQHGRARGAKTDFDLELQTTPKFSIDHSTVTNYDVFLKELQSHNAFHGDGTLESSIAKINFEKSLLEAERIQNKDFLPYGPFVRGGSNCSRFVHSVVNAGLVEKNRKLKLNWFIPLTPTPMSNVKAFDFQKSTAKFYDCELSSPQKELSTLEKQSTLKSPTKKSGIPQNAQWLSGEGAGSWFFLEQTNEWLKMSRFSPNGALECTSEFKTENKIPKMEDIQITYPSNCSKITLLIKDKKLYLSK